MSAKRELLSEILNPEIFHTPETQKYFYNIFSEYPEDLIQSDFEKIFMDIDRKTWLVDDSLMRTDKMSMAHGLEARVPILDKNLVEISQKIPTSWKIKRGTGKKIFRGAFKEYILPHVKNKPKTGWFTPMAKWLRQEPLKKTAKDAINSLPEQYFNKKAAIKIFEDHLNGKTYNLNIVWALVSFSIWYSLFTKQK